MNIILVAKQPICIYQVGVGPARSSLWSPIKEIESRPLSPTAVRPFESFYLGHFLFDQVWKRQGKQFQFANPEDANLEITPLVMFSKTQEQFSAEVTIRNSLISAFNTICSGDATFLATLSLSGVSDSGKSSFQPLVFHQPESGIIEINLTHDYGCQPKLHGTAVINASVADIVQNAAKCQNKWIFATISVETNLGPVAVCSLEELLFGRNEKLKALEDEAESNMESGKMVHLEFPNGNTLSFSKRWLQAFGSTSLTAGEGVGNITDSKGHLHVTMSKRMEGLILDGALPMELLQDGSSIDSLVKPLSQFLKYLRVDAAALDSRRTVLLWMFADIAMFEMLKTMMQKIILFQYPSWFNSDTLSDLLDYSGTLVDSVNKDEDIFERAKKIYENM